MTSGGTWSCRCPLLAMVARETVPAGLVVGECGGLGDGLGRSLAVERRDHVLVERGGTLGVRAGSVQQALRGGRPVVQALPQQCELGHDVIPETEVGRE